MAIRKSEVGLLSNDERAKLRKLEEELLDPHLNDEFDKTTKRDVCFNIADLKRILGFPVDDRVLAFLRARYSDWRIMHSTYQGDWLLFD